MSYSKLEVQEREKKRNQADTCNTEIVEERNYLLTVSTEDQIFSQKFNILQMLYVLL